LGQDKYADFGDLRFESFNQFEAVGAAQTEIEDYQIRLMLGESGHGLTSSTGLSAADHVGLLPEQPDESFADQRMIVNDENSRFSRTSRHFHRSF
jgi:hypothetical protein